jgi:hypothetical protein
MTGSVMSLSMMLWWLVGGVDGLEARGYREAGLRPSHDQSDPDPTTYVGHDDAGGRTAHAFINSHTDWQSKQRHRIGNSSTYIVSYIHVATHLLLYFSPPQNCGYVPSLLLGQRP